MLLKLRTKKQDDILQYCFLSKVHTLDVVSGDQYWYSALYTLDVVSGDHYWYSALYTLHREWNVCATGTHQSYVV